MFPLRDENPTIRTPVAVIAIIALNGLVWFFVQGFGSGYALAESLCLYGLVPGDLLGHLDSGHEIHVGNNLMCRLDGPNPKTVLTSMFMHGGWFHMLGNMWFLWVFGDNIEDVMGPARFIAFYLLCGAAAAFAQILTDPTSGIPMVGASGAIGGVMGAYALLYPRATYTPSSFLASTSPPSQFRRCSCSAIGSCCKSSADCPPSAQPAAASPSGHTLAVSLPAWRWCTSSSAKTTWTPIAPNRSAAPPDTAGSELPDGGVQPPPYVLSRHWHFRGTPTAAFQGDTHRNRGDTHLVKGIPTFVKGTPTLLPRSYGLALLNENA